MDGIEWLRTKYHPLIRKYLKYSEKKAVETNNLLISDSKTIQKYIWETYKKESVYISYGADIYNQQNNTLIEHYQLIANHFFLIIARLQPDNHIEEIIKGVTLSGIDVPLIIVGNYKNNKYGKYLYQKYNSNQIKFLGSIFEKEYLNQLRYFSKMYFHGHSSGGTNPSLLEAMAASALIVAHDNPFNRAIIGENGFFFKNETQIAEIIGKDVNSSIKSDWIKKNIEKLKNEFNWNLIINSYFELFTKIYNHRLNK